MVLAGCVSECEPGGILFVPQFKPGISVMINVIIVGRSQILPPRSVRRAHPRSSLKPQQLDMIALMVLLVLSGDIESNPGPVRYPCTMCNESVRRNQRAILCSECDGWTHAKCCGVSQAEHQTLSKRFDNTWLCPGCTMPDLPSFDSDRSIIPPPCTSPPPLPYPRLPP